MKIKNILMKDFRESLLYPAEILMNDSHEIRKFVMARISITNCKRILLSYPLLLLLLFQNVLFVSSKEFSVVEYSILILCGAMFTISSVYCAIIIWILYINDIDNQKELWKCKILQHTYWLIFLIIMFSISFLMIYQYDRGIPFVGALLYLCLFPLYNFVEYIATFIASIAAIYIGMYHCGYSLQDNNVLFYALIALVVVSYFAQISQRNSVVFKEYIGSTTFFDPLTGLLNRRGASRFFELESKKMTANSEISMLMLDIDHFKKYNDAFGHDAGDECLKAVSQCIKDTLGEYTKLLIRQGGEEFIVIMPNVGSEQATELAELLRCAVYNLGLTTAHQTVAPVVTISIGTATAPYTKSFDIDSLIKKADEALYSAKESGRNRVITYK